MGVFPMPDAAGRLMAIGEELYHGAVAITSRRPLEQRRLYRRIEAAAIDALAHLTMLHTIGGVSVRDLSGRDPVTERACEVLDMLRKLISRMNPRDDREAADVELLQLRCAQAAEMVRWVSYGEGGTARAA
ncbi:MAG: hypothetical protein IT303_15065 [Dehalococcoidia bacterium]|nr:hypothetical protein [Dehalococcoidia bacterium]